jgi:hypothetical protein
MNPMNHWMPPGDNMNKSEWNAANLKSVDALCLVREKEGNGVETALLGRFPRATLGERTLHDDSNSRLLA